MIGKQIKTMLEEEIIASDRFSKANFGLLVGDGFRELVEEIVKSKMLTTNLMLGLAIVGLSGKDIAEKLKKEAMSGTSSDLALSNMIRGNLDAFLMPLEMLYWGIQIGRRLAKEESEALGRIEATES
jgi:hypothetical protein